MEPVVLLYMRFIWRVSLIGVLVGAMLQNTLAMSLFGLTTLGSLALMAIWTIDVIKNKPPHQR